MEKTIYLVLASGKVFKGKSFGCFNEVIGEAVFTTSMTGYVETLTDPSFFGQIVIQTFPLIGNYGVNFDDQESSGSFVKGYVVREYCEFPSNFRMQSDIDSYLKKMNIVGIYDIDTRELTKIIRETGCMNAIITDDISDMSAIMSKVKSFSMKNAVKNVTIEETKKYECKDAKLKVALMDFGSKENIVRELVKRGCEVIRISAYTTAEEIKALNVDGIMLSNGPGDPKANPEIIEEMKKIAKLNLPIFGICLGHQLLALSQGAKSMKLKYGHRGENQPVKDTETGRVYISSQNHGYAIVGDSLGKNAKEYFVNVNDGTNEGIMYNNIKAFTVQFHPEACGGPNDSEFLFDKFIEMMEEEKCR